MTNVPLARIHGVNDLRLDRIPSPECGVDDVLVQVRECGVCGSDLAYLAIGGVTGPDTPMPLGHELWGLVSEVGANVATVEVGDRVVVQPMACGNNIGNGGPEGGFSPLLRVRNVGARSGGLYRLPASVPDECGALVEPLSVGLHSVNRVAASAQDKAVIFGAGPIGLCILMMLHQRGLKQIAVVDLSDKRLSVAESLGGVPLPVGESLSEALIELHGNAPFYGMPMPASDLFFEATGVRSVFEQIMAMCGYGSRVCLTGVHKEAASLDLMMMLAKEVSVIAAQAYEDEFEDVIRMLSAGDIDPAPMVTHRYSLIEIAEAFQQAKAADQAIKVMVHCDV
ncbi:MAG: alcohol dehydrogenase catalytic domain-containing protein [Pseudomonadota bacterium]